MRRGAPNRIRSTSACNSISEGPATLSGHCHNTARGRLRSPGQEDRRRITHLLQPALGHGEESELVDRSEAIFRGSHDPVTAARLTLEVENGVDEVLQHPRARDHALLRDMPDDDDGRRGRLGEAHELRRALTQLGDTASTARHPGRLHRLNRIDHQQRHFSLVGERDDRLQIVVGDTTQARGREPETLRTQSDLGNRLLTTGVEHAMRGRNMCGNLQEQGRLAYARIASQQASRTRVRYRRRKRDRARPDRRRGVPAPRPRSNPADAGQVSGPRRPVSCAGRCRPRVCSIHHNEDIAPAIWGCRGRRRYK